MERREGERERERERERENDYTTNNIIVSDHYRKINVKIFKSLYLDSSGSSKS